jgi:hypothetical protein
MTQCEGFIFFEFFWICYARFKMRSKRRAWTFLARGWILQKYLWIYDKTSNCEPENDFWKKSWAKLWYSCSSNLPRFLLNRQEFSFLWKVNAKLHTHTNNWWYIHFKNVSYYCWKLGWPSFVMYFQYFLHKKTQFWHLENGNWFFYA